MRRRQFIGLAGAGAAVCAASWKGLRPASAASWKGSGSAAAASGPLAQRVDLVIYDERYPDAERFAEEWRKAGARVLATSGEIVTLWREQVAGPVGSGFRRIVGLTLHSDFEIVRGLAAGHRLRVLQKEHRVARIRAGTLTCWRLGS